MNPTMRWFYHRETDSDPARDRADHTLAAPAATTDPIFQSSSESDSKNCGKIYMVVQVDPPPTKSSEEIQREAEEEIV
jgi:hypothetical protein